MAHKEKMLFLQGKGERGLPQIQLLPSGSSSISGFQPPDLKVTHFHCLGLPICDRFLCWQTNTNSKTSIINTILVQITH